MRLPRSKTGLAFSTLYLLVSLYLVFSQGLYGESFIALILGLPWTFLMVYFNLHKNISIPLLGLLLYAFIIVNAILLYWIGAGIEKLFSIRKTPS